MMTIEAVNFKLSSFDTVLMLGNNFGLFGSYNKARRLLRQFYQLTSRNARIIAETRDPYKTEDPTHLEYHKSNTKRGRMGGQVRMRIRFRKFATKYYDYLLVSHEEMEEILRGTEWKVKEYLDSESLQYIAIIEKVQKKR